MNKSQINAITARITRAHTYRHCFDFGLYTFTMDTESIQMADIKIAFRSPLYCHGRKAPKTSLTKASKSLVDLKMLHPLPK